MLLLLGTGSDNYYISISVYFFTEVYTLEFLVSWSLLCPCVEEAIDVVGVASFNLCCTIVMLKLVFS